jgi:hypothetical protein
MYAAVDGEVRAAARKIRPWSIRGGLLGRTLARGLKLIAVPWRSPNASKAHACENNVGVKVLLGDADGASGMHLARDGARELVAA